MLLHLGQVIHVLGPSTLFYDVQNKFGLMKKAIIGWIRRQKNRAQFVLIVLQSLCPFPQLPIWEASFRRSGKCWPPKDRDDYTLKSYYLASVADKIILNSSGLLAFKGLSATIDFYTKLFEHISMKLLRIGSCAKKIGLNFC